MTLLLQTPLGGAGCSHKWWRWWRGHGDTVRKPTSKWGTFRLRTTVRSFISVFFRSSFSLFRFASHASVAAFGSLVF
ncbi:hypothetical protein E2C01_038974 [Portunus trituberculatus]|uniref:Uncharacterized protein n=1 Tax=Portunus trituberculatus TaxID=210409 RepID=A0A5B7FJD6_PORTR|nr:hypothetical protein [Portunus trituberculatus]